MTGTAAAGVLAGVLAIAPAPAGNPGEPWRQAATTGTKPRVEAPVQEVLANDNRTPAGRLDQGVLTLRLQATRGTWHPEERSGPARSIYAFAEEGRAPQTPGPLVRVREGTELHISVRNSIQDAPLKLYGMVTRPGDPDAAVEIAPGETRDFRFKAGVQGTYYYWATTTGVPFTQRTGVDSMLTGAVVIDPARASDGSDDRIFVIGEWLGPADVPRKASFTINGRSWPHTERQTLPFGQAATWRVINAGFGSHPMHLHGTFYTVESRGNAARDVLYGPEGRRLVTTELLEPGGTMMMRWVPDRVGNWLFHCHILAHVSAALRLGDLTPAEREAGATHAEHDIERAMAGLVIGITVLAGDETAAPDLDTHEPRRLKLFLQSYPARYGASPGYGFSLVEGDGAEPPFDKASTLSPTVVLTKGEPIVMSLMNRLPVETAIHWHGMELESFNDGVPGWSGRSGRLMPSVRPGEQFDVRFTPPRAGTFIYHTHGHDSVQLSSGLYGPLIVLDPGQKFDPAVDRVAVFGGAGPGSPAVEINRSTNPAAWELRAGVKYRFRLINITPNFNVVVSLRGDAGPVSWRAIAKDGPELPPAQATARPARQTVGVGETYDFEYQPSAPGELRLEAVRTGLTGHITSVLIRVTR